MGWIRAQSARAERGCRIVHVADTIPESAEALAKEVDCEAGKEWERLVARPDVDAVVVATPHKSLAPITIGALRAGKHIFSEKPMARTVAEADEVLTCHRSNPQVLTVGFTLRHHPAIARARALLQEGAIGEPFYVRGSYGHGGRPGYEGEWRADQELAGGGEMLDQGIHLIDLSRCFLGEFREVSGLAATFFRGMPGATEVRTVGGGKPTLKTMPSCCPGPGADGWCPCTPAGPSGRTDSPSRCSGGRVPGRRWAGGSYGLERLTRWRRAGNGGRPQLEDLAFGGAVPGECSPSVDEVWSREWAGFRASVLTRQASGRDAGHPASAGRAMACAGGADARQALRIVRAVYEMPARAMSELSD